MRVYAGRVEEMVLEPGKALAARISCPAQAIPAPGQYLLAEAQDAILPTPLFLQATLPNGFLTAPAAPATWAAGTGLELRGPLGRGFHLPADIQRLALAAFGDTTARLLPVARLALEQGASVALFSDATLPTLPTALEAHPLNASPEALGWADYLVLDLVLQSMPDWRAVLGITSQAGFLAPGQALVFAPMPCGGMADCGACAVLTRRGWKLACKDGPVFDLRQLD